MCCGFGTASAELCHSLASVAKRISTSFVDPTGLTALLTCRLIALDKCPGVCPIGICEVAQRIISKAILYVLKADIEDAAGAVQLCGGQTAGMDAAVHAMRSLFDNDESEGMLLVDASNAFNSLNRRCALHNIQHLCPAFSTALINLYRDNSQLLCGADVITSQEGTTQGDPLAMPMYAIATRPLIDTLRSEIPQAKQTWYADDATAAGPLPVLKQWWEKLSQIGPLYGYHVNAEKTWLVTKPYRDQQARDLFGESRVNVTTDGRPLLGAPIGSVDYIHSYVRTKVQKWAQDIGRLAQIADSQPHAAYALMTHGLSSKWSHICRTVPDISPLLQPLEDAIRTKLLPALTGRDPPNDTERDLFALPPRLGGLGIRNPVKQAEEELKASRKISKPLSDLIKEQTATIPYEALEEQIKAKSEVKSSRRNNLRTESENLRKVLPPNLQLAMDLAKEKGASSWLTALPLEEHGFALHKRAFRDAISLRYGWTPENVPTLCACGQSFSVQHSLSCPKGGYPSIRHNELRDLTAPLLTETCSGVVVEPTLQPITSERFSRTTANTQIGARLDIVANGFWGGTFERAFFDVRVFNPFAPSNRHPRLAAIYHQHENLKKNQYEQRLREIEHSSFTPLVFSSTGGLGPAATTFYKRLASLLSAKWDQPYSTTMGWLRCMLSFSLLRSSIMCIRSARSSVHHFERQNTTPVDLIVHESQVVF